MSARHIIATLLMVSAAVLAWPTEAVAVDKAKAIANMTKEAGKAYERGDYRRASQLYWTAWQSAPKTTGLLYNAARTAHIAGQIERAETLYRKFLALPNRAKAAVPKCEKHLGEILDGRADALAEAARRAATEGQHARAATLYEQAAKLSPRRARYAEQAKSQRALISDSSGASTSGANVSGPNSGPTAAVAPSPAPKPAAQVATPAPTVAPPSEVVAKTAKSSRAAPGPVAWTLFGVSAVSAGLAVYMAVDAEALNDEFDIQIAAKKVGDKIDWNYEDATRKSQQIGAKRTLAVISGAVAGVALVGGLWRWLSSAPEPAVSLVPRRSGAAVLVRF